MLTGAPAINATGTGSSAAVVGNPCHTCPHAIEFPIRTLHQESLQQLGLGDGDVEVGIRRCSELAAAATGPWQRVVGVTLGKDGAAAVLAEGAVLRAPALPVVLVDATGAGDSSVICFLAGCLNGCGAEESISLACVAGSLQVTRFGAQEVRPGAAPLRRLAGLAPRPAALQAQVSQPTKEPA